MTKCPFAIGDDRELTRTAAHAARCTKFSDRLRPFAGAISHQTDRFAYHCYSAALRPGRTCMPPGQRRILFCKRSGHQQVCGHELGTFFAQATKIPADFSIQITWIGPFGDFRPTLADLFLSDPGTTIGLAPRESRRVPIPPGGGPIGVPGSCRSFLVTPCRRPLQAISTVGAPLPALLLSVVGAVLPRPRVSGNRFRSGHGPFAATLGRTAVGVTTGFSRRACNLIAAERLAQITTEIGGLGGWAGTFTGAMLVPVIPLRFAVEFTTALWPTETRPVATGSSHCAIGSACSGTTVPSFSCCSTSPGSAIVRNVRRPAGRGPVRVPRSARCTGCARSPVFSTVAA